MILGQDGNFYGTTSNTIFQLQPPYGNYNVVNQSNLTTLANIGSNASLVQASDGTFYGTSFGSGASGGAFNDGTVFKMDPTSFQVTTLVNFTGQETATPKALIGAVTNILSTSVQFNGIINAGNFSTTVVFQFGTDGNTFPYQATATPGTVTGSTDTAVIAPVAGLTPGTTYYYRMSATNVGGTTVSGQGSFTTLTTPVVTVSPATLVTSQTAQLNGTVNAEGASTLVTFEYGTDGVNFPYSFGGTPSTVTGNTPAAVSATLSNSASTPLVQGTTYYYRIQGTSLGGIGYSDSASFSLDVLSGFLRQFPNAPPSAFGFVLVDLTPTTISPSPGWRFVGEQLWRQSGVPAFGLVTGNYNIEYQPAPGYIQPPPETISVTSGGTATVLTREYYPTPGGPVGGLEVTLEPQDLAGAQWQILGQNQWYNSGDVISNLSPGNYLVQCAPVSGQTTPAVASITVPSGPTTVATLTYFAAATPVGAQPAVLPFSTVINSATPSLPYAFVGQIRSDVGSATGFVVQNRVVATAGHVVFDDGSLSYVTGLQWLFQRSAGTYEPVPQIPQGFYVFDGYAAQRTAEATPGLSSPASQNLDAAALYFLANAGNGGYAGYVASDSATNEFLTTSRQTILVGYPVDGITAANQGQMFATPPVAANFTQVPGTDGSGNPYQVYTTSALTSVGGNSGGPLCILFDDGNYYPAAIYLGGSAQTVVRAIDSRVVDLFNRAEVSGNGGANNVGGGITQVNTTISGGSLSTASLQVNFASGTPSGATWAIGTHQFSSGNLVQNLTVGVGSYELHVTPLAGFLTPPTTQLTLVGGQLDTVNVTYEGITGQPQSATATAGGSATFTVGVSGTPTAYQWQRNGVNILGATSASYTRSNLTTVDNGSTYSAAVTWGTDGSQTSSSAILTVNQSLPVVAADTPVMPPWALALLAMLLFIASSRFLHVPKCTQAS